MITTLVRKLAVRNRDVQIITETDLNYTDRKIRAV